MSSATSSPAVRRVERMAVIGVGLMGGSLVLGLRAAGLVGEVVGASRKAETLARARELRLIDRAASSPREACVDADLVVLATPVQSLGPLAAAIAPALKVGAVVTDVGSVKSPAIAAVEKHLPEGVAFVGCHPIAGTEHSGPDAALPDLFRGRRCIVCPGARATAAATAWVESLWAAIGALPLRMDAAFHDRVLAAGSHLPHVAAYALASVLQTVPADVARAISDMAPASLRDTTRIAESGPAMWRDIFLDNRAAMLPLMDELLARTAALRAALEAGDGATLERLLDEARAAHRAVVRAVPGAVMEYDG